jgi:light-regulated signal transduction histidine kinase (bacteriophytochrome)
VNRTTATRGATAAELRVELEAARAEMESLRYAISHDLRAPVRAVLGYALALQEDCSAELGSEGLRLLAVVSGEAGHLNRMIEALLEISQIGNRVLEIGTLDMSALAADAAGEVLRSVDPAPSVTIEALPSTEGDAALMRQLWANLLSNAAIATAGRPDARIVVSATPEPDRTVYSVCDNGMGFDEKYADRVFGAFQKLHHDAQFPGLGVGLAIVQRIVHRHGGSVWFESRVGAGATFSFALPLGRAA